MEANVLLLNALYSVVLYKILSDYFLTFYFGAGGGAVLTEQAETPYQLRPYCYS